VALSLIKKPDTHCRELYEGKSWSQCGEEGIILSLPKKKIVTSQPVAISSLTGQSWLKHNCIKNNVAFTYL
jgi:hypothetical protein